MLVDSQDKIVILLFRDRRIANLKYDSIVDAENM
jgi:hypothetical protein